MLKSTVNKGFSMTFKNGLTISVQFGNMNYCSNQNIGEYKCEMNQDITESKNAEIAIWSHNRKWFNFGHDTIKGYCSADEVAIWIDKVRRAKNINTIKRIKS
jgi:hypothetical protein